MAGESSDNPLRVIQVVEDPAFGTPGAPLRRHATLAEIIGSGGSGGGGGSSSGAPAVYGTILSSFAVVVSNAWATVVDANPDALKRLFYNPSDIDIEIFPGEGPAALDHNGLTLPTLPQGAAAPAAPTGTPSATGGSVAANTYFYRVTSVTDEGVESAPSPSSAGVTVGGSGSGSAIVSTAPVARAKAYRFYRGTTAGSELLIGQSASPVFADLGQLVKTGVLDWGLAAPLASGAQPVSTQTNNPPDVRGLPFESNTNFAWAARHYGTGSKSLVVVELGA